MSHILDNNFRDILPNIFVFLVLDGECFHARLVCRRFDEMYRSAERTLMKDCNCRFLSRSKNYIDLSWPHVNVGDLVLMNVHDITIPTTGAARKSKIIYVLADIAQIGFILPPECYSHIVEINVVRHHLPEHGEYIVCIIHVTTRLVNRSHYTQDMRTQDVLTQDMLTQNMHTQDMLIKCCSSFPTLYADCAVKPENRCLTVNKFSKFDSDANIKLFPIELTFTVDTLFVKIFEYHRRAQQR